MRRRLLTLAALAAVATGCPPGETPAGGSPAAPAPDPQPAEPADAADAAAPWADFSVAPDDGLVELQSVSRTYVPVNRAGDQAFAVLSLDDKGSALSLGLQEDPGAAPFTEVVLLRFRGRARREGEAIRRIDLSTPAGDPVNASQQHAEGSRDRLVLVDPEESDGLRRLDADVTFGSDSDEAPVEETVALRPPLTEPREVSVRGVPVTLQRAAWAVSDEGRISLEVELVVSADRAESVVLTAAGMNPGWSSATSGDDDTIRRKVVLRPGPPFQRGPHDLPQAEVTITLPLKEPVAADVGGLPVTIEQATLGEDRRLQLTLAYDDEQGEVGVTLPGQDLSTWSKGGFTAAFTPVVPDGGAVRVLLSRKDFEPPPELAEVELELGYAPLTVYEVRGIPIPGR